MSLMQALSFVATLFITAHSDEITQLPGQPAVDFKQYSGYVEINSTSKASIFYWFQECESGVEQCPLFLWTNGGPGCSGLQGALTEQGAFRIQPNGTLALNPHRWNKHVNIVFIEQPIGVGFSTSTDANDYISGDQKSAQEIYQFILGFYQIFPQLKHNDFYLSSESYGGHYVPVTAQYIIEHDSDAQIPFKGFFLGNPLTDSLSRTQGHFGTYYGHQIISYPLFNQWRTQCDNGVITNGTCAQLRNEMNQQIQGVFTEALDFPACLNASNWTSAYLRSGNPPYNCLKVYSAAYLNRADVRNALYVSPDFNESWVACADINYNSSDVDASMIPIYHYLVANGNGLHMTIYSGDDDSVCSTMSVQQWIYDQGWTMQTSWTEWLYQTENNGEQLGGYYVRFKENVNFITIHTAGHETPFFKPLKTELVLQKFLQNDI